MAIDAAARFQPRRARRLRHLRRDVVEIAISENDYRARSSFMLLKDPCNPKSTYPYGQIPASSFAWLRRYSPVAIA